MAEKVGREEARARVAASRRAGREAERAAAAQEAALAHDSDAKLWTGIKVNEAVMRAASWWEETGRMLMRRNKARQRDVNGSEFGVYDSADPNALPSKIVAGMAWDELDRQDKLFVVKAWHHEFVEKPLRRANSPLIVGGDEVIVDQSGPAHHVTQTRLMPGKRADRWCSRLRKWCYQPAVADEIVGPMHADMCIECLFLVYPEMLDGRADGGEG